jgi:hypothetical protein
VAISSTQVSRAAEQLDAGLAVWRERPLDETPYVFLDARYERVREGGQLVDCAVLVAVGITKSGHRRVLGVSAALSEAEVHWRAAKMAIQPGRSPLRLPEWRPTRGAGRLRRRLFSCAPSMGALLRVQVPP